MNLEFELEGTTRKPVKDLSALRQPGMMKSFVATFSETAKMNGEIGPLDTHERHIRDAFAAAAAGIPDKEILPKRPWISNLLCL